MAKERVPGVQQCIVPPVGRVRCRKTIEVGSLRQGLETLARLSPAFFLRLAASVEHPPESRVDSGSGLAAPAPAPRPLGALHAAAD
jgi:hypothetical protein